MTHSIGGKSDVNRVLKQDLQDEKDTAITHLAQVLSANNAAKLDGEEITPINIAIKNKDKKPINKRKVDKSSASAEKSARLGPIEAIKKHAEEFAKKNPEFKKELLSDLRLMIHPLDTKEEILQKVLRYYKNPHLIDEALSFLELTTDGELHLRIKELRNDLMGDKPYTIEDENGKPVTISKRDIIAGRNIGSISRETVKMGFETTDVTPVTLRVMYHDITNNPREPSQLFQELSQQYNYNDLKKVINFLLHSLGADMKSGGPSIEHGLLSNLLTQTKSLQLVLLCYNFFRTREKLVKRMFKDANLSIPFQLTFENMAKQFMSYVGDRFPSADKALKIGGNLGVDKSVDGTIIVLSQMRDGIREVSPRTFKSPEHRNECFNALIEALENLEDQLDEMEGQDFDDELDQMQQKFEKSAPQQVTDHPAESIDGDVEIVQNKDQFDFDIQPQPQGTAEVQKHLGETEAREIANDNRAA